MLKYLILALCVAGALSASLQKGLVPMMDGRIIGGRPVDISEYPHQISLVYHGSHRCGGSIVGDGRTILTAAHCVYGASPSNLQIRAGSSYLNQGGQLIDVSEIRQHEDFDYSTADYDVAILKLSESVKVSSKSKAIKLNSNKMRGGEHATISGWGTTREGGSSPKQLQAADIQVVNNAECQRKYGDTLITNTMLCGAADGKDSCQGDSGGPLIVDGQQAGVVSWGAGCALPNHPGVYVNVHNLLAWIEDNME